MNIKRTWLALILGWAGLPAALLGATENPLQVGAQYHFVGGEKLAGNTNLATVNRIAALPSTSAFRNLALDNFSAFLFGALQLNAHAGPKNIFSPLLGDLLHRESLGVFGRNPSNALEFVVAVRLSPIRGQFWHEKLAEALGGAGESFTVEGFTGWRWTKAGAGGLGRANENSFWIVPAQEWLLIGRGSGLSSKQSEYLQEVSRQGHPGTALGENLLEAEVDISQMGAWLPAEAGEFKPARIKLTVGAKSDHLDINGDAVYPAPIPWNFTPWQIPTELVRGRLVSFTAGQDVAAFLSTRPAWSQIEHNPLTNQFCAWALGDLAFQNYMEWPVPNASNALKTFAVQAPPAFNSALKEFNRGEIVWLPDDERVIISKLGMVVPSLGIAPVKDGQFLLLSMFPLPSADDPAPEELWAQVKGHSELVWYDWEVTGPRLQQWRLLSQILLGGPHAGGDETVETTVIKEGWLNGIGSPTGNTVTVISREAPDKLSFARSAPLGLNGLELILLSDRISRLGVGGGSGEHLPSHSPMPNVP